MILVTGGTGLIGSHLLYQLLHTEERIRVLKRKGSKTEDVKNIFLLKLLLQFSGPAVKIYNSFKLFVKVLKSPSLK